MGELLSSSGCCAGEADFVYCFYVLPIIREQNGMYKLEINSLLLYRNGHRSLVLQPSNILAE